ncbi:DUF433 domain-containing protein [Candidatus Uhrbacteria bacterium]|nr:DUF433 domain-containing protein [Candidatus Uhrbacteria bacterium]
MRLSINKYIVSDSDICHGKPTFKGTRVMVWQILSMLSHGESTQNILEEHPSLTTRHIQAALDYASSLTQEHYVIVNTQAPAFAGRERTV